MGTERGPGNGRDSGLLEQRDLEFLGAAPRALDVGEGVEGATRRAAAKAGNRVQFFHHDPAAGVEGGDHLADRRLVPGERRDSGELGRGIDA